MYFLCTNYIYCKIDIYNFNYLLTYNLRKHYYFILLLIIFAFKYLCNDFVNFLCSYLIFYLQVETLLVQPN